MNIKHLQILMLGAALSFATGCQKKQIDPVAKQPAGAAMRVSSEALSSNCPMPYQITLESTVDNGNGTYTWTWSVKNPNPGNGNGGTVQNLSHWSMKLNNCGGTSGATLGDVTAAAYSANGTSWTSFTPTQQVDPSMMNTCNINTGNVLKFDFGTTGNAKSYYRVTLSRDFDVNMEGEAFYKSGTKTKCGTICFPGIGCEEGSTPPPNEGTEA
jgi:hypothetical protein